MAVRCPRAMTAKKPISVTLEASSANGVSSIGARRTGAEGFGAWIIWPLPTYRPTWLMPE